MSLKYINLSKWLDNVLLDNVLPIVIQDNNNKVCTHLEKRKLDKCQHYVGNIHKVIQLKKIYYTSTLPYKISNFQYSSCRGFIILVKTIYKLNYDMLWIHENKTIHYILLFDPYKHWLLPIAFRSCRLKKLFLLFVLKPATHVSSNDWDGL